MNIIEVLKEKYNLSPNSYYFSSPYGNYDENLRKEHQEKHYKPFYNKWIKYTEENWYGPGGLGFPMPENWYAVLDEFLEYVLKECPEFKIHQLKIKFGGARIYLGNVNKKIQDECFGLEELLFDKHLIY